MGDARTFTVYLPSADIEGQLCPRFRPPIEQSYRQKSHIGGAS